MINKRDLADVMGELATIGEATETAFFLIASDGKGALCYFAATHEGPWRPIVRAASVLYETLEAAPSSGPKLGVLHLDRVPGKNPAN